MSSLSFPPISCSSVYQNATPLRTQEQKNADLFKAIGRKDFEEVKALLKEGADINAEGSSGNTPLHGALILNNYETAKFLLDNGADPEIKCQNLSPLGRALSSSQKNLVMLLIQYVKFSTDWKYSLSLYSFVMNAIDHDEFEMPKTIINWGVDVNPINTEMKSFLHGAVEKGALELTRFLIQKGANLEAKRGYVYYHLSLRGTTPLHCAVIREDVHMTKLLIDSKADLNAKSTQLKTPLRLAIEKNKNTEIAELLILAGANLNDRSAEDKPLLNLALEEDNGEISRLLIENGADLNVQDKSGDTPLHIATSYTKKIELAKLLIEKKADINARDIYGYTPLFKLSWLLKGGYDLLQLMLKNGANLNVRCNNGKTLLHSGKNSKDEQLLSFLIDNLHQDIDATGTGHTALLAAITAKNTVYAKLLIDKGANVNVRLSSKESHTPLRAAIKNNLDIEIIKSLILAGADLNEKGDDPPLLHFVLNSGMDEIAKLLIEHGADINLENNKGETPLFEAVRWTKDDNYDFLQFMIAHGACLDVHDKQGNSLLHPARSCFDNRVLTFLVESLHQYINTQNLDHARTPLHCAVLNNDIDYIRVLLDKGADPNVKNKGGETALYTAILQSYNDTSYHEIITLLSNHEKQDLYCMTATHDTFLDAAIEQRRHYLSANDTQLKEGLNDNVLLIKKLLENDVKINRVNTLYNLINQGDIEFLKFIIYRAKSPFPNLSPKVVRALNLLLLRVTELRDAEIRRSIAGSISEAFQNKRVDQTMEFVIEAMEKEEERILSIRLVKRNYKKFNLLNSEILSLKKQIKSSTGEKEKRLEHVLKAKKEELQLFNAPIDKAIKLHQKKDFESAKTLLRVNKKVQGRALVCAYLIGKMAKGNSREKISLLIDRLINSTSLKDMLKLSQVFSIVYELSRMSGAKDLKKVELLEKATRNSFKDLRKLLIVQLFIRLKITNVLTEYLQIEEKPLDYLEKEVEKLFETNFNLTGVEDINAKYEKTFSRFRSPIGIFIYAAALSSHLQKDTVKKLLSLYVKDVLEGRFLEERYSVAHSEHLRAISEVDGGLELLEIWKKGKTLLLEDPYKSILSSMPSAPNYLDIFKLKIVTDGHLGAEWESKYPYLFEALNDDDRLENVIDRIDIDLVAKKEEATQSPSEEISKEISAMEVQRKVLALCQPNANVDEVLFKELINFFVDTEFSNDLKGLLTTHLASPKKTSAYTVCDTDDPQDIILMGQEIQASCQRLGGDAHLNCGLLGPLLDGKYRIIAVKDTGGKLVARCLLKLLWDKELKRPVLFQERLYVNGHCNGHAEALNKMCLLKAQEMNITLLNKKYFSRGGTYPNAVSSIGGRSCFEYVDALGGVRSQVYDISKCQIVWEPTASL
jgi:ankyrin repeat protein